MKANVQMVKLGLVLVAACVSGVASANCPAQLTPEERISCIQIEGSGVSYQDNLAERAENYARSQAAYTAAVNPDIAKQRQDVKTQKEEAEKISSSSVKAK